MSTETEPPLLTITLATRNQGKRQELERWLSTQQIPIQLVLNPSVGDIEETGNTFLENALLKAQATPAVRSSGWVLAEDSGLVVPALDGQYGLSPFPGLKSNRWLTPDLRDALLARAYPNRMPLDRISESGVSNSDLCQGILTLMSGKTERQAYYYCGMVLWQAETKTLLEALEQTPLWITEGEAIGSNGFGYDPIMKPLTESGQPQALTMAQLSADQKNSISHRGKAFQNILKQLEQYLGRTPLAQPSS